MPKSVITGYSWNIRERVRTKQSMKKNPTKPQNLFPGQNTSSFRLSTHVVQVLPQSSPLVSELRQHFPDCSFLTLLLTSLCSSDSHPGGLCNGGVSPEVHRLTFVSAREGTCTPFPEGWIKNSVFKKFTVWHGFLNIEFMLWSHVGENNFKSASDRCTQKSFWKYIKTNEVNTSASPTFLRKSIAEVISWTQKTTSTFTLWYSVTFNYLICQWFQISELIAFIME